MFEFIKKQKVKIALTLSSLMALVSSSSAAMNWTPITDLITGLVDFLPNLVDLVVAMIPIIITMAIVGFIVAFLDKILDALKIK